MQPASRLNSGTRPPSGVSESCIALTAPCWCRWSPVANSADMAWPKRTSLPSILPARRIDAERGQDRIAGGLRPVDDADADDEKNAPWPHRMARPWRTSPTMRPKAKTERDGDDEQRPDLEDVGPGVRVLERMRGIGVEEAAAVGAELLDRLLARHRADARSSASRPSSVVASTEPASVCGTPSATRTKATTIESGSRT